LKLQTWDENKLQELVGQRKNLVIHGDNHATMKLLKTESIQLVYTDPPFNTGKTQKRGTELSYKDSFDDFESFIKPRIQELHRLLKPEGTLYLHLDWHEVHNVKVKVLDEVFGKKQFLNEIIWAYDYGARATKKWPTKHDNILVYVKDAKTYHFDNSAGEREPYMAPGLVGPEKAKKGKLPTDVWWHTIVSPMGKEKTGYPTQKPLGILRRIVTASSLKGEYVLDPFGGSGTTGAACAELQRNFILIDRNIEAIETMQERYKKLHIAAEYGRIL